LALLVGCGEDEPISCPARFICEGDLVMECKQECNAGDCMRVLTESLDCAATGAAIGVPKTCGGEPAQCIDTSREPCTQVGAVTCGTVETAYRVCTANAAGTFWDSRPLSQFCAAGQLCHPAQMGAICYTPPAESCAAGTASTCDTDGKTVVRCEGTAEAGYIVTRFTCTGDCGYDLMGHAACL
jgi:hypothetical protein